MQKVKRDKNKHIRKKKKKRKKRKKREKSRDVSVQTAPSVRSLCILATTREAKAYPPHLPLHKISRPLPASFRGASATAPHLTPLLASSPLLHLLFSPRGGGIAGRRIVSGWPRTRSASTRCSSPPPPRARLRSRRGPVVVPAGSTAATLSPSSGAPPPPPRRSRYDLHPARALALPALLMCTCVLWTRRGVGGIFQFCRRCATPGSRLGVVLLCAIVALIMIPRDDFEYWWWFLQSSGDGKAISVFFFGFNQAAASALFWRRILWVLGGGGSGFWVAFHVSLEASHSAQLLPLCTSWIYLCDHASILVASRYGSGCCDSCHHVLPVRWEPFLSDLGAVGFFHCVHYRIINS